MEMQHKQFSITDFKSGKMDDGRTFIEGYANTKGSADRYGDIPTVFKPLRDYVYDLKEFKKNPVLLLDHMNSVENIAGSFSEKVGGFVYEDEKGLKFKAIFSDSDFAPVKHARTVYSEGHGKALSIGGKWFFENKDNLNELTLADIHEISLVGVGADPNALTTKKIGEKDLNSESAKGQADITDDTKAGRVLSKANEDKVKNATEMLANASTLLSEVLGSLEKNEEEKVWIRF